MCIRDSHWGDFYGIKRIFWAIESKYGPKTGGSTSIQQVFGLVKTSKHVSLEDMEQAIGYIVLSPRGRELERGLSGVDESIGICVGAAYNAWRFYLTAFSYISNRVE